MSIKVITRPVVQEAPLLIRSKKLDLVAKLRNLLDVPGCETPWDDIVVQLHTLRLTTLNALHYRIQRAMAESYEEGTLRPEDETAETPD